MRRVLVWSNDPVGATMAGPGIRYLHFARSLATVADVTLGVPHVLPNEEVFDVRSSAELRRLSRRDLAQFDVIVAQSLQPASARRASRAGVRLVFDLYAPALVEPLAYLAAQPGDSAMRMLRYEETRLVQLAGLQFGDAFLCASERQRDLWLGALGALGRLTLSQWEADPRFADLVVVVPFGLDPAVPPAGASALRGVLPGIENDDFVLVWAGGIWNWFDPLTIIEAVARLTATRGDVKLFFLGTIHPSDAVDRMTMTDCAVARANDLGVTQTHVFFNEGWVPYAERHRYLLDADLGVSAHFDTLETRFAFRTRLIDYFWARLPVVCTRGDVLGDVVADRRIGRVLPERDVDAWVEAIGHLADDPEERAAARERLEGVRAEYAWSRVCEPLVRLVNELPIPASGKRVSGAVARAQWAGMRASVARRGVTGTARAAARVLQGRLGRAP